MKDRTPEDIAGEALEGIRRRSKDSPVYPNFSRNPQQTVSDAVIKHEIPVKTNETKKGSRMSQPESFFSRIGFLGRLAVGLIAVWILYFCISLAQDWFADRRLARKIKAAEANKTISQMPANTPSPSVGEKKPSTPTSSPSGGQQTPSGVALKSPYSLTAENVTMSSCASVQNAPEKAQVFTKGLKATPGCAWVEVNYKYGVFMVQVVGGGSVEFPYQKDIIGVDKSYNADQIVTLLNHIRQNPDITDKRVLLRVENNIAGSGYTSGFFHIF